MNIRKNIDLFKFAVSAQTMLQDRGVSFNVHGYPDLTQFDYLETVSANIEVVPYSKRNQARNPAKTLLVFFEPDPVLYGYVNTLDKVASNLSIYYGATGFDLSPCLDFSLCEQNAAILVNSLINGLLMTFGIRVIPTLRIGGAETIPSLATYPKSICYAFGAYGCNQRHLATGQMLTGIKLAMRQPSQILAYGRLSALDKRIFGEWGIPWLSVADYQSRTRGRNMRQEVKNV